MTAAGAAAAVLAIAAAATFYQVAQADPDPKSEMMDNYRRLRLEAPRAPKGDPQAERPSAGQTNPAPPTGILEVRDAPFPSSEFRAENRWQGLVDGYLVAVLAGLAPGIASGLDQSRLVVLRVTADGQRLIDVKWYDLPSQSGKPRIAAEWGHVLLVRTQSGRTFTFHVERMDLNEEN